MFRLGIVTTLALSLVLYIYSIFKTKDLLMDKYMQANKELIAKNKKLSTRIEVCKSEKKVISFEYKVSKNKPIVKHYKKERKPNVKSNSDTFYLPF